MMNLKRALLVLIAIFTNFYLFSQQASPISNNKCVIDTFYNHYIIKDQFRWLEDKGNPLTKQWIKEQNKKSRQAINQSLARTNAKIRIDKYDYYKTKHIHKEGNYFFSFGYYNNLSSSCLFKREKINNDPQLLVDPNYISTKDKVDIEGFTVSGDSKYLAYQFSRNGSDWREVKVVNLKNSIHKKDHLKGLKFSNLAWKDEGFFYTTYQQNGQFETTLGQRIFYHKLDTPQEEDELVFERNNPYLDFDFITTHNERFLLINESNEKTGLTNIFYIDYNEASPHIKPLVMNYKYGINILDSHNGKIIALTSQENNGGIIVEIDPQKPTQWRAITQDFKESVLLNIKLLKDKVIALYQSNQHPILLVYNYSGEILYKMEFPAATSVSRLTGNYNDECIYYYFSSYTIPPVAYKFNVNSFKRELIQAADITFDYKDIEYKEVEYTSNDSVKVPMILVYKKDLKLDGNNPTILKAYGGFGIVSTPSFDAGIVYFIKNGGVFAFANIRGGGDKGKQWAFAGKGNHKQNSFDDFIAGAEYLIKKKYTNPNKLAITGGSNGGLVVAASAIQRPDLFKLAVPNVAPTDMLRFEKFTVGHWHTDEYGTIHDSTSFVNLYNYSPLHNIKEDVNYPSMLVITAENDDRVPPLHSYKFVAELQNRDSQSNPIYLKVDKKSGHYGNTSTEAGRIKSKAEVYGFILDHLKRDRK